MSESVEPKPKRQPTEKQLEALRKAREQWLEKRRQMKQGLSSTATAPSEPSAPPKPKRARKSKNPPTAEPSPALASEPEKGAEKEGEEEEKESAQPAAAAALDGFSTPPAPPAQAPAVAKTRAPVRRSSRRNAKNFAPPSVPPYHPAEDSAIMKAITEGYEIVFRKPGLPTPLDPKPHGAQTAARHKPAEATNIPPSIHDPFAAKPNVFDRKKYVVGM